MTEVEIYEIFVLVDNFLENEDIEGYKKYLEDVDVEGSSTDILVGILSASYTTAHLVKEVRTTLFNNIHAKLSKEVDEKELYAILNGLDDNKDWLKFVKTMDLFNII